MQRVKQIHRDLPAVILKELKEAQTAGRSENATECLESLAELLGSPGAKALPLAALFEQLSEWLTVEQDPRVKLSLLEALDNLVSILPSLELEFEPFAQALSKETNEEAIYLLLSILAFSRKDEHHQLVRRFEKHEQLGPEAQQTIKHAQAMQKAHGNR